MKDRTKNSIKPFWSWNDKLEKQELENQIEQMSNHGIEGFFMHARGGLKTDYLSEEWFEMTEACLDKADELNMQAWAYDENGWPSGFANGLVPELGIEYQQKSLQFLIYEGAEIPIENIIALFEKKDAGFERTERLEKGVYMFYYTVNPYYIDPFYRETTVKFLEFTHEKYYERFGKRFGTSLKGFFTDEPQFRKSPWSYVFPEEFEKTYGYDLISRLPLLFFEEDGYETVRNDYQSLVARLFQENFIKQMYDWCTAHHCKLTGHMMNENNLRSQMESTNGAMPCYEYFHEPGMDHLGRCIASPVQPKQLGSVARQLNRKTLTETFALCGWDVSLNELKWIAQWQYVNGVTSLCPHLEGYSLRGARKRDYPPSLFTQLPWFDEIYPDFADYFTFLGALLDSGNETAPLLVIHPIHSAYLLQNPVNPEILDEYSNAFDALAEELNDQHILHHYGDETIMAHYGKLLQRGAKPSVQIGQCEYEAVLLPDIKNLTTNTVNLLTEFAKSGGRIYAVGGLPEFENGRRTKEIGKLCAYVRQCKDLSEVKSAFSACEPVWVSGCGAKEGNIHLTMREMSEGKKLLYLINKEKAEQSVTLEIQGSFSVYLLDVLEETEERLSTVIENGKTSVQLDFAEYGSAVLVLYQSTENYTRVGNESEKIPLNPEFEIVSCDDNAITLDKCIYRIDGGDWQPEMSVLNLHNKVLELQQPCDVEMQFSFEIAENFDFATVKLCMENPKKFHIVINGTSCEFADCGMFIDHSIRKCSIGGFLKVGKNTINLSCRFTQSPELYYAKFTPGVHESVLNKLTYDTELENIYLTGDFGVSMEEDFKLGERRCLHGGKNFQLTAPVRTVDITDITHQGFWFFAGKMSLLQKITIEPSEKMRYLISLRHLNAPAAIVYVNGKEAGKMMFAPFVLDVTELLKNGENTVMIKLLSGNRNLLGPHHKPMGESYSVGPGTFSDKLCWTDDPNLPPWTDNYNFVLFGIDLEEETT